METRILQENLVKNAGAISWSDVDSREAALIERCTAGDEVACAELVSTHQRMVYGLALHLLGDRDEALDLSQEVFLRVFRTLSSFRGQSALRTWIYRIVINQATQPPAVVAPAPSRRPGVARRAPAAVRRPGIEAGRPAGPAAGQQGDGGAHLAGAGRGCRSISARR